MGEVTGRSAACHSRPVPCKQSTVHSQFPHQACFSSQSHGRGVAGAPAGNERPRVLSAPKRELGFPGAGMSLNSPADTSGREKQTKNTEEQTNGIPCPVRAIPNCFQPRQVRPSGPLVQKPPGGWGGYCLPPDRNEGRRRAELPRVPRQDKQKQGDERWEPRGGEGQTGEGRSEGLCTASPQSGSGRPRPSSSGARLLSRAVPTEPSERLSGI